MMRLSTSAPAMAGASERASKRVRLASFLGMGLTVGTFVSERKIPFINLHIVMAAGLLDQRPQQLVSLLPAQPGEDLFPRGGERHHLGRLAADHLEEMESVLGRHDRAHLARPQAEDDVGERR